MRAHFAGDVVSGSSDNMLEVDRNDSKGLEARIDSFKRDTKNMEALAEFVDDVLQKAEAEAAKQQRENTGATNGKSSELQQPKEKSRQTFAMPDFKNGKVANRARGLVVRIFDAICNCANTAAAAPAQRLKLRGKRNTSTTNGGGDGGDAVGSNDFYAAKTGDGSEGDREKPKNENGSKDKKSKNNSQQ